TETSNIEELLHVADVGCKSVVGQAVEKDLAITLLADAIIEEHQHSTVRPAADQPPKPLLQSDSGLRDLVIVKRIAAVFPNFAQARIHHRIAWNGERQLINDNAAQLIARHVDALPECRRG